MRIANVDSRLRLLVAGGAVEVQTASRGRCSPDPGQAVDRIDELASWSDGFTSQGKTFLRRWPGRPFPHRGR
jgi:hypothetical protein